MPLIAAYLDPNASSLLMQLVLGGIAAVLVVLRLLGPRIRLTLSSWLKHKRDRS